MLQLSHQVNNKPLLIALGMAFILHFLFTLTYHIDFTWTAPKQNILHLTIAPPALKMAILEPDIVEPNLAKPEPGVTKPDNKPNIFTDPQWAITKKVSTSEYIQKIFVDTPVNTVPPVLSLSLFVRTDLLNKPTELCSNGMRNYSFIECPVDHLVLTAIEDNNYSIKPLFELPTPRTAQLALSTTNNPQWLSDIDNPYENRTHLAGLPTVSLLMY